MTQNIRARVVVILALSGLLAFGSILAAVSYVTPSVAPRHTKFFASDPWMPYPPPPPPPPPIQLALHGASIDANTPSTPNLRA